MEMKLYRAVRFDHDGHHNTGPALKAFIAPRVQQCLLYNEVGTTTLKPHYQGWIKFETQEQADKWDAEWPAERKRLWPSTPGAGRGGNRHSYCKPAKKETALVYAAKDGDEYYNKGVSEDEVKRLKAASYQKGETRKQTFMNGIVKRMQDKGCCTDSEVFHELVLYYDDQGKELNEYRLAAQCNSICFKMWGRKFSQYMVDRQRRYFDINIHGVHSEEEDRKEDIPAQDKHEGEGPIDQDDQGQQAVLQEVVSGPEPIGRRDDVLHESGSRDMDMEADGVESLVSTSVHGVPESVQSVQGSCPQVDVPASGDRGGPDQRLSDASSLHRGRQVRRSNRPIRVRHSTVQ